MASKTGQVIYLKKGDPGQKGDRGPSLRGPMDWEKMATGFQFQCGAAGEDFLDVVIYGGKYYQCIVSHKKTASNYPGSNYNYWRVSSNLSFVATDLLKAAYAVIENLGVRFVELSEGGYIRMTDGSDNVLFEVKDGNVTCNTGTFKNVDVQSGTIGGFGIADGRIGVAGSQAFGELSINRNFMRVGNSDCCAFIGASLFPASLGDGLKGAARLENKETGLLRANVGAYVDVSGVDKDGVDSNNSLPYGNHAFYVPHGGYCGFRLHTRRVSTSQTLTLMDNIILCVNSSDITLTLPDGAEDGQMYFIRKRSVGNVLLHGDIQRDYGNIVNEIQIRNQTLCIVMFDEINGVWTTNNVQAGWD